MEWQPRVRVRLVSTTDETTELKPGATGTVRHVDGAGTAHVDWDDGHSLGMTAEDVLEPLDPADDPRPVVDSSWGQHGASLYCDTGPHEGMYRVDLRGFAYLNDAALQAYKDAGYRLNVSIPEAQPPRPLPLRGAPEARERVARLQEGSDQYAHAEVTRLGLHVGDEYLMCYQLPGTRTPRYGRAAYMGLAMGKAQFNARGGKQDIGTQTLPLSAIVTARKVDPAEAKRYFNLTRQPQDDQQQ